MINDLRTYYEETSITNNEKEAKKNWKTFTPTSNVLGAKWAYK